MVRRETPNTKKHVVRFIDSMGPYAHNTDLFLREFSKFLTDRVYTWYINLKPGAVIIMQH